MNFKAFNKDIEISAVVKSVTEVKDLFRAYNIQIEEEDVENDMPSIIEPIIEMTCDDSDDENDMSWHDNSESWHDINKSYCVKDEPSNDGWTSSLDGRNPLEESLAVSESSGVADIGKDGFENAGKNRNSGDVTEVDDGSDPSGVHRCDLCGAGFRIKHSITKHKRVVHGMHQFTCMFCQTTYPLKRNLLEHILTHRGPHGFRCEVCNKVRPNYISIQRHFKTHAAKNIPCTKCDACFKTKWELKSHEVQHQEDRRFECKPCCLTFANPTKLREHMMRHNGHRPFVCDICGKDFTAQGNLTNHRKLHFIDKPFKCQYCSLTFLSALARKKHIPVHERERRKPYECQDCNKKYTSTTSLAVHRLKFHGSDQVFHCHYCKAKFKSKTAISVHMAAHAAERPHSCQQCPCRYKNKRELRRHQREKSHYDTQLRDPLPGVAPEDDDDDDYECDVIDEEWPMPEPEVCLSVDGSDDPLAIY